MIINMIKAAVGFLMIAAVFLGYLPQPEYIVELTCISNTLGGMLLLADGVCGIAKKPIRLNPFYRNAAVSILTVFLICMGSLTGAYRFNFRGAFFFLHVVNPLAFLCCYLLFVNEQKRRIGAVFTAPVLTMLYLLFDGIRCRYTGEFVYGFIKPEALTPLYAAGACLVIYAALCLLGASLFASNRLVHRKK